MASAPCRSQRPSPTHSGARSAIECKGATHHLICRCAALDQLGALDLFTSFSATDRQLVSGVRSVFIRNHFIRQLLGVDLRRHSTGAKTPPSARLRSAACPVVMPVGDRALETLGPVLVACGPVEQLCGQVRDLLRFGPLAFRVGGVLQHARLEVELERVELATVSSVISPFSSTHDARMRSISSLIWKGGHQNGSSAVASAAHRRRNPPASELSIACST